MRKVPLNCEKCEARNYTVPKKDTDQRLELKKFCKTCNTHTLHKESI
ncbi:50S ribosomal protein L33 [Mammaliicoccus sciuri]|uniref:Large ribosomal subunit protein bL33 n=1 Tax=Mammaliicoccus sciuri TaxID=1296 RepID=A0AB37HMJ3_MAMSC|nr:50S ribosomal protein L33 [Mammaliicoccus sciuri]QPW12360.1 50S ribosomal protein L33 [Mammaliicoccus sciuri]QQC94800.1 50S ribosomal protein L33 [Mammaliicoccus sciuri]QRN91119.1 50S ribosomal protein L33 [Mammaliicoccus sciuri]QYG31808.1 50S ribosomal protein L33 [Mammaliicoccus sciuri]